MKLSIIVPVYNPNLDHFKMCMAAIKPQLSEEVELIIVDDASTKDYLSIIDDVPHTLIQLEQNMGQGMARQRGLEASSATYITFVDQDDEFFGASVINGDFQLLLKTAQKVYDSNGTDLYFDRQNESSLHGMIFNRQALIDNEISFSETLRTNEDLYFMSKIGAVSYHEMLGINEENILTYKWYLWEDSTSHKYGAKTYFIDSYSDYIKVQKELLSWVVEKWGVTPYVTERVMFLVLDTYFLSFLFPMFKEVIPPFIKWIMSCTGMDIYEIIDLTNNKDAYTDSYISSVRSHGALMPTKTIKEFLMEIK